jgi:hypothetical protein
MNKRLVMPVILLALTLVFMAAPAIGQTPTPTPSTNDANRTFGWAHFNVTDNTVPGEVTVDLVNPRYFSSCFEYRTDGDETQKTSNTNFNRAITDGLYPFKCVSSNDSGPVSVSLTLEANEYIEIRMVFGAEADERFGWTRVNLTEQTPTPTPTVAASNDPKTTDDCKNGGWKEFGFKNQGQCNRFISTGVDSREP